MGKKDSSADRQLSFVSPIAGLYPHIRQLAQQNPDAPALLGCDMQGSVYNQLSYRQLEKKIAEVAAGLRAQGLKEGDAVAMAFANSIDLLLLSWAAWSMGIITVPLDEKRDTYEQRRYKLKLTEAKLLVTQGTQQGTQPGFNMPSLTFSELVTPSSAGSASLTGVLESTISWKRSIDYQALVLFTSGTTSLPKGAKLSLTNLVANAQGIQEWFGIRSSDRFLVNLPLHHINSTTFCLATLLAGGSIVIPPAYSKSRFWQQLAATGSTFTSIVPTICYDQLSQGDAFAAVRETLKVTRIQIGSAPVVVTDVKGFMQKFGIPLYQGYGQTETALRVTGVPLNLKRETYERLIEENSIGKTMKWAELAIMDAEGNLLGEGKEGELAVRGPIVMQGYIDNNQQPFRKDYFLTGDLGYYRIIECTPFFFLKGRLKEIIIKGGVNISPVAVEDKLKQVSEGDVDQAYVIGVPHPRYGEEIGAVICWQEGIDVMRAKARLKHLLTSPLLIEKKISRYETPRFLATIAASDLPLTSTGKVQRSVLKQRPLVFEATEEVATLPAVKFVRLTGERPESLKQAWALYNYCWQPLSIAFDTFCEQVDNGVVIAALSPSDGKLVGLVSFLLTADSEDTLSHLTYDELTANQTLRKSTQAGTAAVCVSVCSQSYEPPSSLPAPITASPSIEIVRRYLEAGLDRVYNFHRKPKGGLEEGATLVALLPNARQEDRQSLGYTMLLKYPSLVGKPVILSQDASIGVQLIESAMLYAQQLGIATLYAFSRPAGLGSHILQQG